MIVIDDSMRNELLYDGSTPKFGITVKGSNFIVKAPKDDDDSVFTEYVASSFIKNIGYSVHNVGLGYYKGNIGAVYYDGIVDVILDFSKDGESLHSFKDLGQSSVDTDLSSKEYTYNDVVYVLENIIKADIQYKDAILHSFWQMYICDAILGNRDRHWGNWGFLQDNMSKRIYPSPLYDNGGSLFPGVSKVIKNIFTEPEKFMYDRTVVFPASLLKKYDSSTRRYKRTNYKEVFSDLRISKILAYERSILIQRIGLSGIISAIVRATSDSVIPKDLVNFYRMIVVCRYLCIVERLPFKSAYRKTIESLRGYIL